MPLLIEVPVGWDKSIISRRDPSFFSLDLSGEQCKFGHGGLMKGPEVCCHSNSLLAAELTASGCSVADRRLGGLVTMLDEEYPLEKPCVKPLNWSCDSCSGFAGLRDECLIGNWKNSGVPGWPALLHRLQTCNS